MKKRAPVMRNLAQIAIAVGALAIGASIFLYLRWTAPRPEGLPQGDPGRLVRVFRAEPTTHRLRVDAYGTTRASEVWTAIAEVHGRTTMVAPRFEPGELLPEDFTLVQIDPTDYDLAISQLEAEVRVKEEQKRELKQNTENLQEIATLQKRQVELAEEEYKRQKDLFERRAGSTAALETAENAFIMSKATIQETRNKLALIPVQMQLTQASLDAVTAQLKQARRNRDRCQIRLPARGRCISKAVERDQYVTVGQRLGTFLALDMAEVVSLVEARKIRSLFPQGVKQLGKMDMTDLTTTQSLSDMVQVPVEVRWGLGDLPAVWYGRVARIGSSLDPGTRTVPVIVEVPHPYRDVQPGVRPPLMPDIFCEVTFFGAIVDNVYLLPRDALRDDRVYLLRDGKLHIQPVTVMAREKEDVVISKGLEPGDQVILTDLFPASEGMPLRGEVVESPVKVREKIEFPADLFERADAKQTPPASTPVPPSVAPGTPVSPPGDEATKRSEGAP